jgi:hypothetical protein
MYAANPPGDGAQAPAVRADDRPRAKIPANDEESVEAAANDEVGAGNPPANILPIDDDGGGGGGGGDGGGEGGAGTPAWIKVTMLDIKYVDQDVGFLTMDDGGPALGSDGGNVLRLLFYLTYTSDGRNLLLSNKVDTPETRKAITEALKNKFRGLQDERIAIALDAHFAAGAYVAAFESDSRDKLEEMARQQEIYRQRLLAILGALYDDAMGRDFSCVW